MPFDASGVWQQNPNQANNAIYGQNPTWNGQTLNMFSPSQLQAGTRQQAQNGITSQQIMDLVIKGQQGDERAKQQALSMGVNPQAFVKQGDNLFDKTMSLAPYAGMAALTLGSGAFAGAGMGTGGGAASGGGMGGASGAGTAFSMEGGLTGTGAAATGGGAAAGAGGAGMSAAAGAPAYAGQVGAASSLSAGAGGFGSAMPASAVAGGGTAAGGGFLGTGMSGGTALGLAGLANNIYQNQQNRSLAGDAANQANSLAQPQRQQYQDLLSQYYSGGQDITKQPIFANALDLMNRQSTARMAAQQQTGNQGAMAQEFNKNATQQLNSSAMPYLQQLSGQAGFGFPASGASGQLYGQYNNQANQQIGYGLSNLFAGMNSSPGGNTGNQNYQYWPGSNQNTNSSGAGSGSLFGNTVYSRA
jgi:hypothetical protein